MTKPPTPPVDVLLFDLGAVLIDISFDAIFEAWGASSGVAARTLKSRYEIDAAYKDHERDLLDAPAYWESLRESIGIDLSDTDFHKGWNAIFQDEITAVTSLLHQLHLPLYVFSNTNRVHQEHFETTFAATLRPFRRVFTSNDLGERKPDAAAFLKVAAEIGAVPERILFFDDSAENITGAVGVGMQTCHVTQPAAVGAELVNRGLLP